MQFANVQQTANYAFTLEFRKLPFYPKFINERHDKLTFLRECQGQILGPV